MSTGLPCGKCGHPTEQVTTMRDGPLPPGMTVDWCGRCMSVNMKDNPFINEIDI